MAENFAYVAFRNELMGPRNRILHMTKIVTAIFLHGSAGTAVKETVMTFLIGNGAERKCPITRMFVHNACPLKGIQNPIEGHNIHRMTMFCDSGTESGNREGLFGLRKGLKHVPARLRITQAIRFDGLDPGIHAPTV